MNIVSIERILIIDILVLICTMIGMNYADPEISECMSKVDQLFVVNNHDRYMSSRRQRQQYESIEERIKFITKNITLEEIKEQFIETMYVRHLYNAISERTHRVAKDVGTFCSTYGNFSDDCTTALKSVGIERNATSKFIVKHVYYNLKQTNAGYIYDLVQHVHNSLQFMKQDLFGVEDTQHFCRVIRLTNTVRDVFPSHCNEFHRDDVYVLYTYLYINVNNLNPGLTKGFLEHLFTNTVSKTHYNDAIGIDGHIGIKAISMIPPDIYEETFCDFFGAVLNGEINTELAESIRKYCTEIELQPINFDRQNCIQDIIRLELPVESFNETAETIYFNISMYEIYNEGDLNDNHIIKYADHYIRFIFNLTSLLEYAEVGGKTVRTPERYCANNLEYYEDIPKRKKGLFSCMRP